MIILSSSFRSIGRSLSSLLVFAGLAQSLTGDAPTAPSVAEILSLEPGAFLEREIRGGETQSFELRLEAGTFLLLEILQRGAKVSSRLLGPDGATAAEGDGPETAGSQLLAALVDRAGAYRLDVIGGGASRLPGSYRIAVVALRPAAAGDEARVSGARRLTEARRLAALQEKDSDLRARALMEEALASWQAAGDGRGEIEALAAMANFHSERGEIREAIAWHEKILVRAQAIGFAEGEAWAWSNLGYCNSHLGNHDQAVKHLLVALDQWQRIGGPYEQAFLLRRLGQAYSKKQDFDAALATFDRARSLALAAGDRVLQGSILLNESFIHYLQSRQGKARELLEEALDLSRQAGDAKLEATIEQNLAATYYNEGLLQKALDLFISVAERKPLRDSGMTRYNMGNLYFQLGDLERALENYQLSREAFHSKGESEDEVKALIGIGRVRQRKGEARAALEEYSKARELVSQERWIVLHSLGLAQIDLLKLQEALRSLARALEIARASRDRSQEATTLLALGTVYKKLDQPDSAVENLNQAITVGETTGYQTVVAPALLERSLLRRDQHRLEEALADVEDAIAIVESTRRNIADDQLRTGFLAVKRTYYDLDIDLLLQLDRLQPGMGYQARALEASERSRARGLLDLLAEGRIDLRQGLDPDLRRREDDLADQISRVQSELRAGSASPERLAKLRTERDALELRRQQFEVEIQTRNKRYAEVRYPVPLKLEEIQSRVLDEHTALLEYVLGERRSILFVITREEIRTYEIPSSEEIADQVVRLREAVERENLLKRRDYLQSAFQLYRHLVEPAAAALAGKSNLLIVPDGVLYYLPFEALLTEPGDLPYRDLPYLLRRHSIAYIPSASVLAGLREPRREPIPVERKEVVAFAPFAGAGTEAVTRGGAQDFSPGSGAGDPASSRGIFKPLPASGREIAQIAKLYPGAALSFVDGDADEAAVTRNPAVAGARRLHFATHAQVDERHPEYSALVLAERQGEDGLLQVREIFNLELSAELAVLSACETALGKEVTGEGLVGLTRAFFYAGVPSLVVSLWNVVDGPTPDLMLDFYKNLDRLRDKARALQTSKLSMIARGNYSHPSYWAPFILLGEPR